MEFRLDFKYTFSNNNLKIISIEKEGTGLFFQGCICGNESFQARGQIGVRAASLYHSHSNLGSKPHLHPTAQLTAMPDPEPTEQGQGSNLRPHGC